MSLRRSARLRTPATSPEERMVPLIERGTSSRSGNAVGPQESHPSSGPGNVIASDVNGRDHGSSESPEPSLPPTQPVSVVGLEEEDVLCEAFTELHYQEMLQQANNLYPFNPNTIVGTPSIPEALPASQPRRAQMPTEGSSTGNGMEGMTGVNDVVMNAVQEQTSAALGTEGMTDVNDVVMNAVQEQTAVALAFQGKWNTSLAVTLMSLSPQPTTNEVLRLVANSTEANTRLLCRALDALPGEEVNVGTARKPVLIRDLHVHHGDPNVRYRALGTLEEARSDANKYLMPCMDCPEADSHRQFPEPPIPLSIPLLILYFERQDGFSPCATVPATASNMASTAATPAQRTKVILEEGVSRYLGATIDPMLIGAYQEHVIRHRLTHKAYSIMIMARLIEMACTEVNINYDTGNARSHKSQTHNGPDVALDDVVLFFMDQTPSHLKTVRGMATAPSTFNNYRSWHLRAKDCLAALEGKSIPEGNASTSVELVQKLLNTEVTNLGTLDPRIYGSWENFTERIRALKGIAETGTA